MPELDLNAPAFGPGSQTIDQVAEAPTEEAVAEPVVAVEETAPEEVQTEESVEESKVPYSRFKKFHDEAKFYAEEAEKYRLEAESLRSQPSYQAPTQEVPDYWRRLYGDSPESIEAWKIQSEQNEQVIAQAREEAVKAVTEQAMQEQQATQQNLAVIDEGLEVLTDYVGRNLTNKEQEAVLDIVDEYTPKGEDGNYLGAILPFEKAWEIYELKNQASKAPKIQSRNSVAALSGTQSQGSTEVDEKDKSFNPLDWNSYKRRL